MTTPIFGPDRICTVVAATTAAEAAQQFRLATGLRNRSRTIELRLDYLCGAAERTALLGWLGRQLRRQRSRPKSPSAAQQARSLTVIATCRTRRGGGEFDGSWRDELDMLAQAANAGCGWCDVEIETAERLEPAELRSALAPARVLVSAHDFRRLPRDVPALIRRLQHCGGEAIKLAAVCRTLADLRRLLAKVGDHGNVVAIPMGEDALAPRVISLREGSALTYVAISQATAPGQLSLPAAKHVYYLTRSFRPRARSKRRRGQRATCRNRWPSRVPMGPRSKLGFTA